MALRQWATLLALAAPLAGAADGAGAQQQQGGARQGPPHEWVFGAWTGGIFPVGEVVDPAACFGGPTVVFTRDVVMRAAALDVAYHQRAIETAATAAEGLEFRFVPAAPVARALGGGVPPDVGFGCPGGPNVLRVQRRGPDEIVFPDCADFPSPLKRCVAR